MTIHQARLERRLRDVTARYQEAGYFPSAAIRVFNDRGTLAAVSIGDGAQDALFDVASVTKIATATQILFLIRDGRLALHAPVASVLPRLEASPFLRERFQGVTVYRLLTHTSSLPAWYPFYTRRGEDFYDVLTLALQTSERTEGVVYSDLNFMLLGKVIERLCEKPLAECLRDNLTEPLALGDLMYRPAADRKIIPSDFGNAIEMDMCRERGLSFDGWRELGVPVRGTVNDGNCHYFFDDVAGHAGVFATAEAYERLCRYYLTTSDPLLTEAQREQKTAPRRGIGFQTGPLYPHGCGHLGFTGTSIYFSKEYHIGAVALTNRLYYPQGNPNPTNDFRRALHETVFALCAEDAASSK
ncbi:MAG: beta-lactamase family protein [Clostridia bacterium]|nr:beta-lactamase family protein [Clostridia bacterium]